MQLHEAYCVPGAWRWWWAHDATPSQAVWPRLASVVAVLWVLFAAFVPPALAAEPDRHQVYRVYRGIEPGDLPFLSVEADAFATAAEAHTAYQTWASPTNRPHVTELMRTSIGRPNAEMEFRKLDAPDVGDEATLLQLVATQHGTALHQTVLVVREGEVIWFLICYDRDDDFDELLYVYDRLEGRRPDGADATNLLPDLADLPYPMREDRTEVWATPEPS